MNQSENTESFLKAESRILLAGNGINDAQKIQWDDMLRFVQDKMLESKDISETDFNEDIRAVSPTLFFESLCKKFSDPNEGEKRLRQLVKEYVGDKSNFIHKLWSMYNVILTTNFDNNLVISKSNLYENNENPKEKTLTSENNPLYRRLDFTYDKVKKSLFFIHGYFRNPSTICLGFEQYSYNLKRIEDFVIQEYSDKNHKKKKTRKSVSWIDYFFMDNTTIDILGLSLCNEEIDLWWILNYRKKILNRIKNNKINYYDIPNDKINDEETKAKHSAKTKVLESFGINVVSVEKAKAYSSNFYCLCVKTIREDIHK